MGGYIGSNSGTLLSNAAERKQTYSITTATTSLTGLRYTPTKVHVFHNGVRLVDSTDYTATNGTSITLTNAAQNGDEVVVISYPSFQTSDTVSAANGGTFAGNVEHTGTLTASGAFTSLGIDDNATSTAMTLDSAGRVMIGTTTEGFADADNFTVSGSGAVGMTIRSTDSGQNNLYFSDATSGGGEYVGYLAYQHDINAMRFGANGADRMRIDSNGKVLIGKTAAGVSSTAGVELHPADGGTYSTITSGNTWHVHNTSNYGFYVNANGGIYNYQSNNSNLSDEREKKNIETLDDKWDAVKAWSLKKFHYNSEEDSDPKKIGVIAQDLETNHPELITDYQKTDDETRKSVKEQQMMWMAIKALQEAMAKIETLETKVAALEAE